jgi:hypothetical protein
LVGFETLAVEVRIFPPFPAIANVTRKKILNRTNTRC